MRKVKIYNFDEDALYYTGTEIFEVSNQDPMNLRLRHYVDRCSRKTEHTDFVFCPNDLEHSSLALVHAKTKHLCDKLTRFLNENAPYPEPGKFPEFLVPDWEGDYPLIMDRAERGVVPAKKQLIRLKDCVL